MAENLALYYDLHAWRGAKMPLLSALHGFHGLQDLEIEIVPRLEKLVCRLNAPDEDDVSLLQAPVGSPTFFAATLFYTGHCPLVV